MRRRLLANVVAFAGLLGGSLLTANAEAYCRSRSCRDDLETGFRCERRDESCIVEGLELFRRSSCTSYTVNEGGSERYGISSEAFDLLVRQAFDRWLTVDCGGGRTPSLRVESFGSVRCDEVAYNQYSGNVSVFVFREDWELLGANTYALTTVSFERGTGEIYDADVEINGTISDLVIDNPSGGVDLNSILTHEVGHFLGLAHSRDISPTEPASDPLPVMRESYLPYVEDLSQLREDDVAAICAAYPPNRKTELDSCFPRHGFAEDCRFQPLEARGGCAFAPGPKGASALLGTLTGLIALMRIRDLRRRRRAP